jgi:hypothetical protein
MHQGQETSDTKSIVIVRAIGVSSLRRFVPQYGAGPAPATTAGVSFARLVAGQGAAAARFSPNRRGLSPAADTLDSASAYFF